MSVNELFRIGCVINKKESFLLKSGQRSNLYIDLRRMVAHPKILKSVAQMMAFIVPTDIDFVAGIVAGGVPLAVMLSQVADIPMLMVRTEKKTHGTGRLIEGWSDSQEQQSERRHKVLLVEDVINTGGSTEETIARIRESGAPVDIIGCVCVLNRGNLTELSNSIPIYSLWTLDDFTVRSFSERALLSKNAFAIRLFQRMATLQTNLIWSADVSDGKRLIEILALIAPHLLAVKIHFDALEPNTFDAVEFMNIIQKHALPIISDRKYADIESTVKKQFENSLLEGLAESATVHPIAGPGSIHALNEFDVSSILVVEMSNANAPSLESIRPQFVKMAKENESAVSGFVCQSRAKCEAGDAFVYMTPGVHLDSATDGSDQRYRTCYDAIALQRNDAVIVGRGISQADNPLIETQRYRKEAWQSLSLSEL